jgi:hypothetical protein
VIPVYSLLLVCVLPLQSAHEAAGATGIRRSPRPFLGGRFINASGASRREGEGVSELDSATVAPEAPLATVGEPITSASFMLFRTASWRGATLGGQSHICTKPKRSLL